MKYPVFICIIFLLVSCTKGPQPVYIDYVVQGVLQTELDVQQIKVTEIKSTNGFETGVEGAQVVLTHLNDSYVLEDAGDGVYTSTPGLMEVLSGGYYVLEVLIGDKIIRSNTLVPNEVLIENQSATTFNVDLNTDGNISFFCNWIYDGDYAQVLELRSVEDSPLEIPYVNSLEDFNDLYADPIPNQSVIIKDLNFAHYGQYQLWINVINKDYESLYFNDLVNGENNPDEGIDNIDGAKGFFTSASQKIIEIEVLE